MNDQNTYLADLQSQIDRANKEAAAATERKLELEKAKAAKEAANALAEKIRKEKEFQAIVEENERKSRAHEVARQQQREAAEKARREEDTKEYQRAQEAERLRLIELEREKLRVTLQEVEQRKFAEEAEIKRIEAEMARKSIPVEPDRPQDFVSPDSTHPLARIITQGSMASNKGLADGITPQPAHQPTTLVGTTAPATSQLDLIFTQADTHRVLAEFPTSNRPTEWEVVELLKAHSVESVIEAIRSLRNSWVNQGTLGAYACDHIRMRLGGK